MIKQKYLINAPIEKVWDALTNPAIIDKWGGGPSKFEKRVGGKFSFWGGDIWGKNIKVIPKKELVQEWYGGNWDKPSIASFKLTHKDGCTTLYLTHSKVPEKEFDSIDQGWDEYYLGPIKALLEKG